MQELLDEDREGFEVHLSHIGLMEAASEANPASTDITVPHLLSDEQREHERIASVYPNRLLSQNSIEC